MYTEFDEKSVYFHGGGGGRGAKHNKYKLGILNNYLSYTTNDYNIIIIPVTYTIIYTNNSYLLNSVNIIMFHLDKLKMFIDSYYFYFFL